MPLISLLAANRDDPVSRQNEEFDVIDADNRELGYCLDQYTRLPRWPEGF